VSGQIQDAQTQRTLSMLHDDTRGVCETLRRLSYDLHRAMLHLVGLVSAVKAHCAEVEQRHGVQVRFRADGDFGDIRRDVTLWQMTVTSHSDLRWSLPDVES
jgi:signal transduction histidine kinase